MSLLKRTRKKLTAAIKRGHSLVDIAEQSRGRVDYEWLKKFRAGVIVEPGVDKTENLHDTLEAILTSGSVGLVASSAKSGARAP